jgi:hypothetical protein
MKRLGIMPSLSQKPAIPAVSRRITLRYPAIRLRLQQRRYPIPPLDPTEARRIRLAAPLFLGAICCRICGLGGHHYAKRPSLLHFLVVLGGCYVRRASPVGRHELAPKILTVCFASYAGGQNMGTALVICGLAALFLVSLLREDHPDRGRRWWDLT